MTRFTWIPFDVGLVHERLAVAQCCSGNVEVSAYDLPDLSASTSEGKTRANAEKSFVHKDESVFQSATQGIINLICCKRHFIRKQNIYEFNPDPRSKIFHGHQTLRDEVNERQPLQKKRPPPLMHYGIHVRNNSLSAFPNSVSVRLGSGKPAGMVQFLQYRADG